LLRKSHLGVFAFLFFVSGFFSQYLTLNNDLFLEEKYDFRENNVSPC
jgi:hypothetical protein